jgi:SAM-dependent methyltransferase
MQRFADFARDQLPGPPARVLEVGCGRRGTLTLELADAGYDVTGIDPAAPVGERFRRLKLEDLDADDGPFDAVVASNSLHHVGDLDLALDRIVELLAPRGLLVLDEHAWDQLDLPTAEWYYARWRELGEAGKMGPAPPSLGRCCGDWHDEHVGLHGYAAMRHALDPRFEQRVFAPIPYLYRLLGKPAAAIEEDELIAAGTIKATGFRYVGEALSAVPR